MASHNNPNKDNNSYNIAQLNEELKTFLEILKLVNSKTRLQLTVIMLVYRKIGLSKLSKLTGKTKSAISRQMERFEELGMVKVVWKEARGSIDAKVYEIAPNFLGRLSIDWEKFQNVSSKKGLEILIKDRKIETMIYNVLGNILKQIQSYYEKMVEELFIAESFKAGINILLDDPIQRNNWFFSKKGFERYLKIFQDHLAQVKEILEDEKDEEQDKPYLVFHIHIPLKKIFEEQQP